MKRNLITIADVPQVIKNADAYRQHLLDTYTTDDDGELSRNDFLQSVADRINSDLEEHKKDREARNYKDQKRCDLRS